jgi:hypothetical protein
LAESKDSASIFPPLPRAIHPNFSSLRPKRVKSIYGKIAETVEIIFLLDAQSCWLENLWLWQYHHIFKETTMGRLVHSAWKQ